MSRTLRRPPMTDRTPLEVGFTVRDGQWTVARFEGAGNRMLRYLATGRAGRRAELREYLPSTWERGLDGYQPIADEESERAACDYFREGFELARELPTHPHRAQVLDVFQEAGTFFVIQEWLEGRSAYDRVKSSGSLTVTDAIEVARQAGSALSDLHRQSRLHRDVSPANILLTPTRAMLIDFDSLTPYPTVRKLGGRVFVNPAFAPLELLSMYSTYGPESDVYGLAATLYFLLGGKPPPPAAQRAAQPALPRLAGLPSGTMAALEKALAVRARERTRSVAEFLQELD